MHVEPHISLVFTGQQTFWARRFGAVVDRFGIPWAINCSEPEVE